MRLRTDDRGVTVQIGTVLLFAVLVVLLSTYQATVVPQQNEQVEFNHNQRVQGQLQDLRDGLRRTAMTGSGGSVAVALGTQYPVRALFVNPAPPSGTLETTPPANLSVRNATAAGETGDYWNGGVRNFSTRGLVYDPLYHVYQNPPTTVYRNGVLYNRFDGANRTVAGQQLVKGNTVTLVAVDGNLSESSSGTASVDLQAVSPATRTVTVRNESHNVSVVVPTTLSTGKWAELLAEELNRSVGDDRHVLAVEDGPRDDTVEVLLEPGVYELRLAEVGVGRDVTGVGPRYVTDVRGDDASVAEGGTRKLVVEVRDRYNNPVSGVEVNASTSLDDASVSPTTATTDDEGRVALTYTAPANVSNASSLSDGVDVSYEVDPATVTSFDAETRQNLTMSVHVQNVDGSGRTGDGGDGDDGDDINPVQDGAVIVQNEQSSGGHSITFELNNTGSERNVTSARINFYYSSQTGGGRTPDSADLLGPDGQVRTTLAVGGPYESLDRNGGPIRLAAESATTLELDFSGGSMGNRDYVVLTVIFDDGESAATYFVAP